MLQTIGRFHTVTLSTFWKHLTNDEIEVALEHMLDVTLRRPIMGVPCEAFFGHRQAFDEERLRTWCAWCIRTLGGTTPDMTISAAGF